MSNLSKIISIFLLIAILIFPTLVQALDVNMNLNNNQVSLNNTTDNPTAEQEYSSSGSVITTLNSLPEAELGLTNILSIILIVIGILLILLAIAIIIRLK